MADVRERNRELAQIERPTMPARQTPEPERSKAGNSLVEFSTETQQDPNDGVNFGDTPVHCNCPHCERTVVTFIDYESSWVTYLLAFVVWFSLGWMAFWVLPLLWPAFKDVVHHCPRCLNVIARKSRISLPTFRSEVMTLKVGSCAVVLARKYVVILCGLLGLIVTAYILRSTVNFKMQAAGDSLPKGPPSQLSWEDFLHECGPRTSLGHRTSSVRNFEEHFRRRTFTWQGEVLLIREGFDVLFLHAKSVVMVRMYPPRYPRRELPDVALLFTDDKNSEVAPLSKGDWIEFEATMTAHGHRGDPEVMTLWHIKQASRPAAIGGVDFTVGIGSEGRAIPHEATKSDAESHGRAGEETPAPTPPPPAPTPAPTVSATESKAASSSAPVVEDSTAAPAGANAADQSTVMAAKVESSAPTSSGAPVVGEVHHE